MPRYAANPRWVDQALERNWEAIVRAVPESMLPDLLEPSWWRFTRTSHAEPYGCGFYGCVIPTVGGKLVLKLTTDIDEAWFVVAAMGMGYWPSGIVRYHLATKLEGRYDVEDWSGPVFAIWREEARCVGDLDERSCEKAVGCSMKGYGSFESDLAAFRKELESLYRVSEPGKWKTVLSKAEWRRREAIDLLRAGKSAEKTEVSFQLYVAVLIERAKRDVKALAEKGCGSTVGQAISYYLKQGIALCDVHAGNIGVVTRRGKSTMAITDPGHAVPIDKKWTKYELPKAI